MFESKNLVWTSRGERDGEVIRLVRRRAVRGGILAAALLAALLGGGCARDGKLDAIYSTSSTPGTPAPESPTSPPPEQSPPGGTEPAPVAVTLSWAAPGLSTDGAPLTDLAGYRVYRGTRSRSYSSVTDVDTNLLTTEPLGPGTYYFVVTAYDESGNESDYSSEIAAQVQ